jgi:cytochrome P450
MTGSDTDTTVVEEAVAKFSIYEPAHMQDPHALYAQMRARCPVAHSDQVEPDAGYWILSRYKDVVAASLDTDGFSSKYAVIPRNLFGEYPDRPPVTADGERHTAYRRALQPNFTTPRIKKWEPFIRARAQQLIAEFRDQGTCDVARDYARRLVISFSTTFMGISAQNDSAYERWIDAMFKSADQDAVVAAQAELSVFLGGVIEDRKTNPTDDFVAVLMEAAPEGEKLEGTDLISVIILVLFASLDTTWSALSSALWHLASHPADRQRLVDDPSMIPRAAEEFLRYYAPVALTRETTKDVEVGGCPIGKHEMVLLSWPSANRDEEEFEDGGKVVIDRKVNRHITFGVGPHRCIGSPVARLEIVTALEEFLKAIPEFELAEPESVTWTTGHVWGPENVKIRFPKTAVE